MVMKQWTYAMSVTDWAAPTSDSNASAPVDRSAIATRRAGGRSVSRDRPTAFVATTVYRIGAVPIWLSAPRRAVISNSRTIGVYLKSNVRVDCQTI